MDLKRVLTIAGSDSSGGAGIQADLKTIAAHRLYGESAITALTAQNTCGVTGVLDVPPAFVAQQIDAVFDDIRPDAVKIGMVSAPAIVGAIAERLRHHGAAHTALPKRRVSRAPNSWARTTPAPTETPLKKHTMVEIKKAQVLTAARATLPDHCPTIMESTVT